MSFFHFAQSNNVRPTVILGNQEGELSSDVNFTRNTKGSRWDSGGLNELIGVDQPRYNYNPATGIYEGMTIMGQWTNEIKDPRDMTTGSWSIGTDISITRDQVGIDGKANTACLIDDTSNSISSSVEQDIPISDDSNSHTTVFYIKKDNDESRFPLLEVRLENGTQVQSQIYFNTKNGNTQVRTGTDEFIVEDIGDWWELTCTLQNNNTGNTNLRLRIFPSWTDTLGSDNSIAGSIVFDAAQVFLNRSTPPPTPVYGETAGQSYTQDPDIATVTDLDAINFNPQEGTFVVESNMVSAVSGGQQIWTLSDGTDNNRIVLTASSGGGDRTIFVENGGVIEVNDSYKPQVEDQFIKTSVSYTDTTIKLFEDGVEEISITGVNIPQNLSQLDIGKNISGGQLNGFIREFKNFPRELTNDQHIQETS